MPAPTGGWQPDAQRWEVPVSQAPQLDNFLIQPGKLVMRGPMVVTADLSTWYPLDVCGVAMTNTGVMIGRKNAAAAGQVDPWNVVLLNAASSSLASGLTTGLWVVGGTVSTYSFANADSIPGPRWIDFEGLLYGISYDSAGSPVADANTNYYMKPLSLITLAKSPPGGSPQNANGALASNGANGGSFGWGSLTTGLGQNAVCGPITTSTPLSGETFYLEATSFGFSLPSTAVIQGIEVTFDRHASYFINQTSQYVNPSASNYFRDLNIALIKGGTVLTSGSKAGSTFLWNYTTTPVIYGNSTDLWGQTWAYTDINAANFGVAITGYFNTHGDGDPTANAYLGDLQIRVFYTIGASETITVLSNAPHGAVDLIGYQSRIWLLGGIDTPGSGTTYSPTTLFFTNPIVAGGGSASADWKDPVTGLTNKIPMDGDSSDYGVGVATVRNGLVVFRKASVYLLKGSTTANYALVPITRDVGCVDARSIIETMQGVYFMSQEGLMLTNGSTVVNVSGSITHTLQAAILAEQRAVIAGQGGYITCGRTSRGQLIVSIGIGAATAGSISPIFTAMYDPDAVKGGAWVRLTSQLWSNDGTQLGGNLYAGQLYDYKSPKRLVALGDRYVTALEDQTAGISLCDYNAGLYDQLPSGANPFVSIPATWRTVVPAITTSAKRKVGQAKRYYIDYSFAASALVPTTGWTVTPIDSLGATLDTFQTAVGSALAPGSNPIANQWVAGWTPTLANTILRANQDFYKEIDDISFVVTWPTAAVAAQTPQSVAEIYGLGLEFQMSREQRGLGIS